MPESGLPTFGEQLLVSVLTPVLIIAAFVLIYSQTPHVDAHVRPRPIPRWFSSNPSKRWGEQFFLLYSPVWIAWVAAIVASGSYESFGHVEYLAVCSAMALPCFLAPLALQPAAERARPFWGRYWVKANAWLAVLSFVGNYVWTWYFFTLLGASYTFPSWRLNGVPVPMFLATHAYFCGYHSATTVALRRWWTSSTHAALPRPLQLAATAALVCCMAWLTAFLESWTIQGFPYYAIKDRAHLYTVGSVVYGLYFVVSFPMFARLDEEADDAAGAEAGTKKPPQAAEGSGASWTIERTVIDALAACMIVTLLLDFWRLAYGAWGPPHSAPSPADGLPWFGGGAQ